MVPSIRSVNSIQFIRPTLKDATNTLKKVDLKDVCILLPLSLLLNANFLLDATLSLDIQLSEGRFSLKIEAVRSKSIVV